MKKLSTLYLCYFGLREPLVQTQVLPYLREITKGNIKVFLLTFETNPKQTWSAEQISEMQKNLKDEGINWEFLTYHKKPSAPATLFDVVCGSFYAWRMIRKENIDILHSKVHVPAMMAFIAKKMSFGKVKHLFDIRGFFPDEYVDAGIWEKDSLVYKAVKKAEQWLLKDSDAFITLTEKAREILFPEAIKTGFDKFGRPVEVIPCCVDLNRFELITIDVRNEMRRKLNIENRFVIAYVGSLGGFYMTQETADFYGIAKKKKPETFALILTQSNPEMIKPLIEKQGLTEKDYFIQRISPKELPMYLSVADVGLSFIKPSYSKLASSPTKNAEYLASGLPMIANSGVGDTAEFTIEDDVGYIIDNFSSEQYEKALVEIERLLENRNELIVKCKESAKKRFDLINIAGRRYRRIYDKLYNQKL